MTKATMWGPVVSIAVLLAMSGCGGLNSTAPSDVQDFRVGDLTRAHVAQLTMDSATYRAQIDVGLQRTANADGSIGCTLLDPQNLADGSTRWAPLHSYIVSVDDILAGDVNGYRDVFFAGDQVTAAGLPEPGVSLRGIPDDLVHYISVSGIAVNTQHTAVTAVLSVYNISQPFYLRLAAIAAGGQCTATAARCVVQGCNSATGAGYQQFTRAHVNQGFFGMPRSVSFQ